VERVTETSAPTRRDVRGIPPCASQEAARLPSRPFRKESCGYITLSRKGRGRRRQHRRAVVTPPANDGFFPRRWTGIQEFLPGTNGTTATWRGNTTWHGAGIVSTCPSPGIAGRYPSKASRLLAQVTAIAIRKDGGWRNLRGWTRCTTTPLTTGGFTLVSLAVSKGMATRDARSLVSDTIRWLPGDRQLRPNQTCSFRGMAVGAHSCRG
jgi:hypothetical protein